MPLNWNVGACVDYEELVCESTPSAMGGSVYEPTSTNDQRNADRITTHLVFVTMAVGMNGITAKNFKEFFRRVTVVEKRTIQGTMRPRAHAITSVMRVCTTRHCHEVAPE